MVGNDALRDGQAAQEVQRQVLGMLRLSLKFFDLVDAKFFWEEFRVLIVFFSGMCYNRHATQSDIVATGYTSA